MPSLPLCLGRRLAKLARSVNRSRRVCQRACLAIGIASAHGFNPLTRLASADENAASSHPLPQGGEGEIPTLRRPHSFIVHFITNVETPGKGCAFPLRETTPFFPCSDHPGARRATPPHLRRGVPKKLPS